MNSIDNTEKDKLINQKIPFVLRDLDMGFNSATRERDSFNKSRHLQILITTAVLTFIMSNVECYKNISYILLLINIILFIIQIFHRWNIFLIGAKTGEQERHLEETSINSFNNHILDWQFGTGISDKYYHKSLSMIAKKVVFKSNFIAWYLIIIILSLTPVLYLTFFDYNFH